MGESATGVAKKVRFKRETAFGVVAAGVAKAMRRVSSDLSLSKDTFESKEIRDDYQVADMRHGMRKVEGKLEGELSPGAYAPFIASTLRRDFTAGGHTDAASVSVTADGFERLVGSFIADGHTVGSVVRTTGLVAASNNSRNFLITSLTALQMHGLFIDGGNLTVAAAADVSIFAPGMSTFVPKTGHTQDSYSVEHYFSDKDTSEVFVGCKINSLDVDLPPSDMAKISFNVLGKDMIATDAEVMVNPMPASTIGVLAGVDGLVFAGGRRQTALSSLKFSIAGNMSTDPVIGSKTANSVNAGRVTAKGDMSAAFEDTEMRDAFIAETEQAIYAVFCSNSTYTSDFVAFCFPRVKLGGSSKNDGEKAIMQSVPFVALLGNGADGYPATTVWVQDSTLV